MLWINGKKIAEKITENLKAEIAHLNFKPLLTIIQVGNDLASNKYISYKLKKATELKIATKLIKLPLTIDESSLINIVKHNANQSNGLIVQLPLPKNINKQKVLNTVPYEKDIDGLAINNPLITPATPQAIIKLLSAYQFDIKNKIVAVIGQSNLVGKPTAKLCEELGAKKVYRLDKDTGLDKAKLANIVIVAIGQAKFIKAKHLKIGAVVIDVGINEIADDTSMKKIVGDVDADDVKTKVAALSMVPGGVGPMTVIQLFINLINACKNVKTSLE